MWKHSIFTAALIAGVALSSCKDNARQCDSPLDFADTVKMSWTVLDDQDILPVVDGIFAKDSVVWISGKLDGKFVHRYSQADGHMIDSHVSIGQGPDEMIYPCCLSLFGDTTALFDMRAREIKMYDRDFECVNRIPTADWSRAVWEAWALSPTRGLLKLPAQTDDGKGYSMWQYVDLGGNNDIIASYDTIPQCVAHEPRALSVLSSLTVTSPDRRHYAVGTTSGGVFQTFDISGDDIVPIISDFLFFVEFDEAGNGIAETCQVGFSGLASDNERLFGSYSGSLSLEDATKIGVWNWDGTPERLIQTDAIILKLAFDADTQTLWGVLFDKGEFRLAKLPLE